MFVEARTKENISSANGNAMAMDSRNGVDKWHASTKSSARLRLLMVLDDFGTFPRGTPTNDPLVQGVYSFLCAKAPVILAAILVPRLGPVSV